MIVIVPYRASWPGEFRAIGSDLRRALSDLALRIDHIGSTAVPGLAAKDRIDIQVSVRSLGPAVESALHAAGYARLVDITQDHIPPAGPDQAEQWRKWLFRPPESLRPVNVHIRLSGRANQRYALLFRDFLRADPASAQAYAQVKLALARYHPDNFDAYYDVKDPVCDLILAGAELWAAAQGWEPGPSDC